jgi:hypothetical protein
MELEHNYYTSRHSSILASTRTSLSSLKLIKSNKSTSDFDLNLVPINTGDISSIPGINETESINLESCISDLISQTIQNNDSILKVCLEFIALIL